MKLVSLIFILALLLSTTFIVKANDNDSIKEPDWSIYTNLSAYSALEAHIGFEKFLNPKKSISFDFAWRHRKPEVSYMFYIFTRRSGGYLTASYNFYNYKSNGRILSSGFGMMLGYFYVNNNDVSPTYYNHLHNGNEKMASIGWVYTGKLGFKQNPFIELFFKLGLRFNFGSSKSSYSESAEGIGGIAPLGDVGLRLRFVKFKKKTKVKIKN